MNDCCVVSFASVDHYSGRGGEVLSSGYDDGVILSEYIFIFGNLHNCLIVILHLYYNVNNN